MPSFDYDLFVIGGGSGGVRSARVAIIKGSSGFHEMLKEFEEREPREEPADPIYPADYQDVNIMC